MRLLEKIQHKFSYHFIIGAVAANLLCSAGGYGAEISEAELEERIAARYQVFGGLTLAGAQQPVCRALQFVWSLADSDDLESGRMIAMILREGRGVGGIDTNRSANESETGVYYSLIGKAKTKGVSKGTLASVIPDTTTVLGRHQLALAIAYDVILVPAVTASGSAQPFVNYVTDRVAFTALNRLCQATWALRQDDWSVLATEIPPSVQAKLTDSSLGFSESVKASLLSHALTLPSREGEEFVLQTTELLPKGSTETAREEVAQALRTLPVGDWLVYMTQIRRLYCMSVSRANGQLEALGTLRTIPVHELELYITQMMRLYGAKHKHYRTQLEVLEKLRIIPAGDLETCIDQIMRLDGAEYRYYSDQLPILEKLRTIPVHEREACIDQTKNLPSSLNHAELTRKLAVARIMVEAPAGEGEAFIAQILQFASPETLLDLLTGLRDHPTRQSFMGHLSRLFGHFIYESDRSKILPYFKAVPADQLCHVTEQIARFSVTAANWYEFENLIVFLRDIPDDREREAFADSLVTLLMPFRLAANCTSIIYQVKKIPADRRCHVLEQTARLVIPGMVWGHCSNIIDHLNREPSSSRQSLVDQVLRFSHSPFYQANVLRIVQYVTRVQTANREGFVTFALRNNLNAHELTQLSDVLPPNWTETLARMRGIVRRGEVEFLRTQTVHGNEDAVRQAVGRLAARYGQTLEELDMLTTLWVSKVDHLVVLGLLRPAEASLARHFFLHNKARTSDARKFRKYLHLAWKALTDESMHTTMGRTSERDQDECLTSYLRTGPIDTQLAYRGERSEADLFSAIEAGDATLLGRYESCAGGSLTRMVAALERLHQDVVLGAGEDARENVHRLYRETFLRRHLQIFLQEAYSTKPERFDDPEKLRDDAFKYLQDKVREERCQPGTQEIRPDSEFARVGARVVSGEYLDIRWEEALQETTPLRVIHEYLKVSDSSGLLHDLAVWAEKQGSLSLPEIEHILTTQAHDWVARKVTTLSAPPSSDDTVKIQTQTVELAKTAAVRYRNKVWQNIALKVMGRVSMAPDLRTARASLVSLVVADLESLGIEKTALNVPELEGVLFMDDEIRGQLYAKIPD